MGFTSSVMSWSNASPPPWGETEDRADGERVEMTPHRVEGRAGVGDGEKCRAPLEKPRAQRRRVEQRPR